MFWDLFGEQGHPIRATVQEMGPLLLSRLLELNETQEGVLNIMFRVAADEKMPLLDLKDLRAMANDVGQRGKSLMTKYGNVVRHLGRRHPAPPAGAGGAGRRPISSASRRSTSSDFITHRAGRPRHRSTFSPPTS